MSNNINVFRNYIQKIAKQTLGKTVQDSIVSGTIKQSLAGVYEVQLINGSSVSLVYAHALKDDTFKEGDNVYLIKANYEAGDLYTSEYIIFGLVNLVNEEYKAATAYERFVAEVDSDEQNFISVDEVIIISNENYPLLIQNIRVYGYFDISATVDVIDIPTGNDIFDYGIEISLQDEDGKILEYFKFNPPYFIGQPYKISNSNQHRFIELNKNLQDRVSKIILRQYADEDVTVSFTNIKITSGSVLDALNNFSLKISAKNERKYIYEDRDDLIKKFETLKVTATGFFETQPLSANVLQYFWFRKDDSITIDSEMKQDGGGYSPLAGAGWSCLTTFKYAQVCADGKIENDTNIKLWNSKNNVFEFNDDALPKYENIIKCIALYQGNPIESNELVIYNYNHENFDATITADKTELKLITREDKITLTCNVIDNNIVTKVNNNTFTYKWYYKENETKEEVPGETERIEISASFNFVSGTRTFYCEVYTNNILVATSNDIAIESLISNYEAEQLYEATNHKIWLSEQESEKFQSKVTREEGSSFAYKDWESENELTSIKEDYTNDEKIKEKIIEEGLQENKLFVYYSSQLVIQKGVQNSTIISKKDWSKPIIVRYVTLEGTVLEDLYTDVVLDQLNAFNELTNNNQNQGLFYDKTDPNSDPNVYVNATYIKTGALTVKAKVKDEEGKEKEKVVFQAGWDTDANKTPLVKIAGFDVGITQISHNGENNEDKVVLGEQEFILGTSLEYKYNSRGQLTIDGEIKSKDFNGASSIFLWGAEKEEIL